jgi:hypothetical protein
MRKGWLTRYPVATFGRHRQVVAFDVEKLSEALLLNTAIQKVKF